MTGYKFIYTCVCWRGGVSCTNEFIFCFRFLFSASYINIKEHEKYYKVIICGFHCKTQT
jgi:hypothetical protein